MSGSASGKNQKRTPRFNHVAVSVPAASLDDAGRADILAFYGEVFGWDEMPTMTVPDKRLVLQAWAYDQFVFITADDPPMSCPRLDHFGLAVGSLDELRTFHDRAERYKARDDRVDLIGVAVDDYGFLKLHNFYVGYLLPMMVEVQYFDWAAGKAPTP